MKSTFSVFYLYNSVRHCRQRLIVSYNDNRHSRFSASVLQKFQHRFSRVIVQCSRRFVAKEHFRIFGKRAGNGNTLLFAARKLRREIVHSVFKTDVFQHFFGRKRIFAYLRRKFNIFFRRQVIDQIIKLEHEPDIVAAIVSQLFF